MWLITTCIQLLLLSTSLTTTLALATSRDNSRRKFHPLHDAIENIQQQANNANANATTITTTYVQNPGVEDLCLRMHNNTAFMGAEPFARLRLYSASDCRKNCLEAYPKCVGVMFYYVHGENKNKKYICYLFDKNSINDEVALVAEKPSSPLDMIRSLEIVSNCHEFDPFPPLQDQFTNSTDKVPLRKRDAGFYRPILPNGPWTQWTACTEQTRNQFRTQPCEYGRIVQRRICPTYLGGATVAQTTGFQPPPGFVIVATPYPPEPYVHPSVNTNEYARIMAQHQEQVQNSCCYRQQFLHQQLQSQFPSLSAQQGQQVFYAMPAIPACERPCGSFVTTTPFQVTYDQRAYPPVPQPQPGVPQPQPGVPQPQPGVPQPQPGVPQPQPGVPQPAPSVPQPQPGVPQPQPGVPQPAPSVPGRTIPAPVWNAWSQWSTCSMSCDIGSQQRYRQCNTTTQVPSCSGESVQFRRCENISPCQTWSPWTEWSLCRADCGTGERRRSRYCHLGDGYCQGSDFEVEPCDSGKPCEQQWSHWEEWSACSVSCGQGIRRRMRVCNGDHCKGESDEEGYCENEACAVWSHWQEWSSCSALCEPGVKTRQRICLGKHCEGESTEQEHCIESEHCPSWSEWQSWSACSTTCGHGVKSRSRVCHGAFCPGDSHEEVVCENEPCSSWSAWQDWSYCSVSCGHGVKTRRRICLGNYCEGESSEEMRCVEKEQCPSWAQWQPWSQCSATCGYGTQTRMRTCSGHHFCIGNRIEMISCQLSECATWSVWGSWSVCSVECGTGTQTRSRSCMGVNCVGDSEESQQCVGKSTTTDCAKWATWGAWSVCDTPCGPGKKTRHRNCVSSAGYNSTSCEGDRTEESLCNTRACCTWTVWNEWSACDRQCGEGRMTRTRMFQRPGSSADDCTVPANYFDSMSCNLRQCEVVTVQQDYAQQGYVQPGGQTVYTGYQPAGTAQNVYYTTGGSGASYYQQPGGQTVHTGYQPGTVQSIYYTTGGSGAGYYQQPGGQTVHTGYQPGTVQTIYYPGGSGTGYQSGYGVGGVCHWSEWQNWAEYQPTIVRRSRTCTGDFGCTCYGLAVQEQNCANVQCGTDATLCIPACKKK